MFLSCVDFSELMSHLRNVMFLPQRWNAHESSTDEFEADGEWKAVILIIFNRYPESQVELTTTLIIGERRRTFCQGPLFLTGVEVLRQVFTIVKTILKYLCLSVGQLHLWNPDDPSTPRGSTVPLSDRLEERLRQACEELAMPWDGCASHHELLALCDHLGLEVRKESVLVPLSL